MDVLKALNELHAERERINKLIAICETRIREQEQRFDPERRGRREMSQAERLAVSERMRRYWEARKAQRSATGS